MSTYWPHTDYSFGKYENAKECKIGNVLRHRQLYQLECKHALTRRHMKKILFY